MAQKHTDQQISEALREAKGCISDAARMLGCSRQTVHNRINSSADVRAVLEDERETTLDKLETLMVDLALEDRDFHAARFLLRTMGRHRGFGDRQEIAQSGGLKIRIVDETDDPDE